MEADAESCIRQWSGRLPDRDAAGWLRQPGLERGPVMFVDHHTFQEVGIVHQVSGPIAGLDA